MTSKSNPPDTRYGFPRSTVNAISVVLWVLAGLTIIGFAFVMFAIYAVLSSSFC